MIFFFCLAKRQKHSPNLNVFTEKLHDAWWVGGCGGTLCLPRGNCKLTLICTQCVADSRKMRRLNSGPTHPGQSSNYQMLTIQGGSRMISYALLWHDTSTRMKHDLVVFNCLFGLMSDFISTYKLESQQRYLNWWNVSAFTTVLY